MSQDGHISREGVREKVRRNEVVVATRDGREVGYARVEFLWSTVPYLSLIWVLESDRRKGVGTAIEVVGCMRVRRDPRRWAKGVGR